MPDRISCPRKDELEKQEKVLPCKMWLKSIRLKSSNQKKEKSDGEESWEQRRRSDGWRSD